MYWHSAGNVLKVGQSTLLFLLLAPCPQTSVKLYILLHLLELINHNTWQQIHKRERYKLRETGNFAWRVRGTLTWTEKTQFLYKINNYEPFHEDIMGSGERAPWMLTSKLNKDECSVSCLGISFTSQITSIPTTWE
jgi:hypothetical protein